MTGPLAATGVKASFCLLDLAVVRGYHPMRNPRQLTNMTCDSQEGTQGISVGWKDIYERFLPGQDIDLDAQPVPVPAGQYYLVNVVDPTGMLWEKDTSNNRSYVFTSISLEAHEVARGTPVPGETPPPDAPSAPASGPHSADAATTGEPRSEHASTTAGRDSHYCRTRAADAPTPR